MGILRPFLKLVTFLFTICLLSNNLAGCAENDQETEAAQSGDVASLKLINLNEGFYEISLESLTRAGIGISKDTLGEYMLSQRGSPIDYWVDEIGDDLRIRFFSPRSNSRYTLETITVLHRREENDQLKMSLFEPAQNLSLLDSENRSFSNCYQETMYEENLYYQPKAYPGEPWLWVTITAPGEVKVPLDIDLQSSKSSRIRMNLWALTEASVSPDHKVIVFVNDSKIGDIEWDGKGYHEIDFLMEPGILKNGKNFLTIQSPGLNGVLADKVFLNWIKLDQPFSLETIRKQTKIACQDNLSIPLIGISKYDIYTQMANGKIDRIHTLGSDNAVIELFAGQEYWFIDNQDYRSPEKITAAQKFDSYLDPIQPAEYLVIGDPELIDAARLLIEWRQSQGLTVTAIPIDMLYDIFNGGYPEPEAIRSFLSWTSNHWASIPRYVLLLGDASYDPKGYQSDRSYNRLPSFFIETVYGGETSSDYGYLTISADQWSGQRQGKEDYPQIALGRLPARNVEQVQIISEKIIAYEKLLLKGSDEDKVLVVADNTETSFRLEGEKFLQGLPHSSRHQVLVTPMNDDAPAVRKVLETWQAGYQWIIYFGHGSITEWGSEQYLSTEFVEQLPDQVTPPIVLQFTCLSGLFTHPEVESLSESLLWKRGGGAIALLAPTSLTLPGDQKYLSQKIVEQMSSSSNRRLGDLLLDAWQETFELPIEINDVLRTFVLLGDPGLLLP